MRLCLVCFFIFYLAKGNATELIIGIGEQNKIAVRLESENLAGSHSKVYRCALSKMEETIKYQVFPQARMLNLLKHGKIDIALPLAKSVKRDKYALFSYPIDWVSYYLYTSSKVDLSDDLSDYTFSVIRSSEKGGKNFLDKNPSILEVNTYGQALKMVSSGRVDGVILPEPIMKKLTNEKFSVLHKQFLENIPVSMYISKKHMESEKIFSRLNTLIESCLIAKSD